MHEHKCDDVSVSRTAAGREAAAALQGRAALVLLSRAAVVAKWRCRVGDEGWQVSTEVDAVLVEAGALVDAIEDAEAAPGAVEALRDWRRRADVLRARVPALRAWEDQQGTGLSARATPASGMSRAQTRSHWSHHASILSSLRRR